MGVDDLRDTLLKDEYIWPHIKSKIKNIFNEWLHGKKVPKYLNKAKIFVLSKDKESPEFPKVGMVRTIAVLPCISKLYESCILAKLK